ncbi:E3 ubiquitin-protein ligase RMA1H1 [Cardamine amara subsp. amara]|uniref:E3 ubiquitin-protein ligase RMA n=1 Tax=Cardamine amara subsp. amara TaxID=228776 RepID=A0ABD0ZR29_CARAN
MSNSVQGETMDLDLNQEPSSDSGLITELSPWLNELETAHERIEERIRHLEAIISRIRIPETTTTTTPSLVPPDEQRDSTAGVIHERSRERLVENGENKTYLISKALNMEKTSSVPGGYFDCNICLEKAENPILTCCGHLFCWGCFYQLPLIYLNIKECPVCDGEVTDTEVIPIYGNGDDSDGTKPKFEDCAIRLPPRPNAKRVESVRQKIINRSVPFIPGHETLEHIRRTIDSIGLQALAQGDEFGLTNIITNGGDNGVQQQQHHHHPPFGPLRLLPPPPFASFPGLVVDTSEILPRFDDDAFDVDSFVDTRRNRRRPSPAVRASYQRIRNNNNSSQTISFSLGAAASSSPREFAVPRSTSVATRNQSVNPTEVVTSVTSASSSRRRTEDVNSGPQTRSRRRLR